MISFPGRISVAGAESGRRRECGVCGSRGLPWFHPYNGPLPPAGTRVLFILPKPQTLHTPLGTARGPGPTGPALPRVRAAVNSEAGDGCSSGQTPDLPEKPADPRLFSGRVWLGALSPRGHSSLLGRGGPQLDSWGHRHRECGAEVSRGPTSTLSFPTPGGEGRAGSPGPARLPCGQGPAPAPRPPQAPRAGRGSAAP